MARRTLGQMFGLLSEDRVATRALSDIIGKAVESGALSPVERQWAHKLMKAIEKSGPDQLVYPKLSFEPSADAGGDAKAGKGKPQADRPDPSRGLDVQLAPGGAGPQVAKDRSQSAWDQFANFPVKPDDVELGAAGAPAPGPEAQPAPKGPGMLSRIFGRKPKAPGDDFPRLPKPKSAAVKLPRGKKDSGPGKAVAQSTWDDLSHSGPKAAEPRSKSSPQNTWDRYANQGPMGDRDAEDEKGPKGRRKGK